MTIAYVNESLAVQVGNSTPITLTYPAVSAGRMLLLWVVHGDPAPSTVTTPADWTLVGSFISTTGTWGGLAGPRRITIFSKEATGSETGTLAVTWPAGAAAAATAQMQQYSKTAGAWDALVFVSGEDTTSGTGAGAFSAACGSIALAPDDMVFAVGGVAADSSLTGHAYSATSITFGTVTVRESGATVNGNGLGYGVSDALVTAGTATGAITLTTDINGDATYGPAAFVRLREAASGSSQGKAARLLM